MLQMHFGISQDTLVIYYDSSWEETTSGRFEYYRKAFKNAEKKWEVMDFFRNGNIQMTGVYKDKKMSKEDGTFTFYYLDGGKRDEFVYESGEKNGPYRAWHENGQIKQAGSYYQDLEEGEWVSYFEDGGLDSRGIYKGGAKEGTWIWYYENGQKSAEVEYASGTMISESYWNEDGTPTNAEEANRMPHFIGGEEARLKYLNENIKYPLEARISGIQGRVFVTFIVERDGSVTNVRLLRGIGGGCDEEAIRVIKNMPEWVPGTERGKPVRVQYNMPILFHLNKVTKRGQRRQ